MNRMSHPLLQDYYDRVAQCLLQRAFSLGQFEVTPPEEIFMLVDSLPAPIRKLGANDSWIVRKLLLSNNHNIRIFYLILLKLCFSEGQCLQYLKKVLKLIFQDDFEIKFPINKASDAKLFNSKQFKKLFIDILYHLDMQETPNIEETIGKYPLIDIVIIYILRSLLTMRGHNYDYGTAIPNSVIFNQLCDYFDIPVVKVQDGYSIMDRFIIYEGFPSYLMVSFIDTQGGGETHRSSVSRINANDEEEDLIKQSAIQSLELPTQSLLKHSCFVENGDQQESKQTNSPNIFESQVVPLSSNLTQTTFRKHVNGQYQNQEKNVPITKITSLIFSPKKKMNLAEEIRKSTMRVSMLKSAHKPKDNVNTQNIFSRDSYFSNGNARQSVMKNSINPSSYQLGGNSNLAQYGSGLSPSKFGDKIGNIKPSLFSNFALTSEVQNSDPLYFGPRPKQSSESSYYRDFTNSFLLQQLPEITKSSIKNIKRNFMKERSNIRMM